MTLKPDYVAVDDLKRFLRVPGLYEGTLDTSEDAHDDIPLALAISSASRLIDTAAGRQFGLVSQATALRYTAMWDKTKNKYIVEIDDLMTTTDLVVECNDTAITDYELQPFNAAAFGRPWTLLVFGATASFTTLPGAIEITANWGWTTVPDTIKNATLLQASRIFKRREAPFGVAGSPELGSQLRLLNKVDPDVDLMISSYKRNWGAR